MFQRRSIESLQADAQTAGLPRTLSALNLVLLGIGCIVGAGIYVLPGLAAAHFAGPGVMLSFLLAGAACALAALCYAELASTMPVSGSAYAYCYAAIGEVFAWSLGCLLLFEYGIAAALLAVGFSGYLASLLRDFGIVIPAALSTPLVQAGRHARRHAAARRLLRQPGRGARDRRRDRRARPRRARRRRSSTTSSCCSRSRCSAAWSWSASRRSTRRTGCRWCRRTRAASPSAGRASCAPRRSCSSPTSASRPSRPRPPRRAIRSATCRSASSVRSPPAR